MTNNLLDNVHINFDSESLWVMNMVLGLVMFGVALEISIKDFKPLWTRPKAILIGLCSQFILLPALTFLFVIIIEPLPSIALGMFMVAACPGGNISNFISYLSKANTALSISLTAIATLLAIAMTPINFHFWSSFYGLGANLIKEISISPYEMIKLVSLLLGLPLVLGMFINYKKPSLALAMAKKLKIVSLVFFVSLVFIALYKNRIIFLDYIYYVFWVVVLHNLIAFSTGYGIAKLFRLPAESRRSITIETGIQNSGLGLLLIFTFFDGLGGMALLAAFWGIWHIVSGLILASIWNNKVIVKNTIA
ncbi:bile acid:sodium symporter family protein [Maribacter confluentis]|uniref:Bile acid:sodium symporter family protein n=1 Tax=Maribacter confluentis TaxID=1656093 RepID=A0ABT8RSX3_9FLAO|nr:bile acid:sodium symporter family protein [Maribacter confluentis]MDO1513999.1 bile acid:sodium symporter family protein [Maribacter confluentis]